MKLHYHKQHWVKPFWWGQVFSFFKARSGGVGVIIFSHEIALIKGENK